MARRAIYDRRGWVLCSCRRCYRLNYVEPHGTTAACACSVDWTEHDSIPYHLRADAGGLTVETDALPPRVLAFLFLCLQIVCWLIGMGAWFGVMYLIFTRYAGA